MEKCSRPPERFYRQKQVRKSDSCWLSSRTTFSLRKRFDLYFGRGGRMTTDEALQNLRDDLNKIINVLKNDWKALLFLTIAIFGMMVTVSYFSYRDARQYYEPQIYGLRTQLSRTQKQLKRASEDRTRQTKRIAEMTRNGG
ncbi:hypothetical protein (phage associated) [Streptococcus pyogenes SSI-1]|nr:hypothetical protein (phage associated) [Streptococcus pyogenes SSI-1]